MHLLILDIKVTFLHNKESLNCRMVEYLHIVHNKQKESRNSLLSVSCPSKRISLATLCLHSAKAKFCCGLVKGFQCDTWTLLPELPIYLQFWWFRLQKMSNAFSFDNLCNKELLGSLGHVIRRRRIWTRWGANFRPLLSSTGMRLRQIVIYYCVSVFLKRNEALSNPSLFVI